MPSLVSMEDLFYGPPEATWILPTREEEPLRRYRERDFSPPRRFFKPEPPLRPVARYDPRPPMDRDLRPVVRAEPRPEPINHELRPIERLARVHRVAEPVPITEEIRKVVEVPVRTHVAPPTQVVLDRPLAPAAAPPTQVVLDRPLAPAAAPPVQVVVDRPHAPAAAPPVQVIQRSVSPPRPIIHHPIELKVPMCCEKCAKKVKERLEGMEGVERVVTDQYNQKVVVYGHPDPERVLDRVRRVKKRSAFWDMTVDYSEKYRRVRQAQAEVAAREGAKRAEVAKQKAQAKAMVAPASGAQVVVNLPQDQNGPNVTAILPAEKPERTIPYVAEPRMHDQRYVSPPRAYRQELYHGLAPHEMQRRQEFYNGRHAGY